MKIRHLALYDFRRFESLELDFGPGLNLVRGPNESGKSTVVAAILACLFARPAPGSAAARGWHRWGAPGEPVLEMEFTEGAVEYRLSRDLGKRNVTLEAGDAEPVLEGNKAVARRVFELVGFDSAEGYTRTACVLQDQLVSLASDAAGARRLAQMLREVVTGGEESGLVDRAAAELGKEVEELRRGLDRPANNPGILKRLDDLRAGMEVRLESASRAAAEDQRTRERLADIEERLALEEPRLADAGALTAKNRELHELDSRRKRAVREYELADSAAVPAGPSGGTGERDAVPPPSPPAWPGWALVSAGVLLAAAAAFLGTVNTALLALLAPAVALVAVGAWMAGGSRTRRGRTAAREAGNVSTGGAGQSLDEARRRAAMEVAGIDGMAAELEPFRLAPAGLAAKEREVAGLEALVAELSRERDALSFHLSRADVDGDTVIALEEELEWLREEIRREGRRLRVYSTALEAMGEAREAMLSGAVPALEESIGAALRELTGGRYDTVEVSESDLGISVYSQEKGGMVPADDLLSTLSRGTACQLYLAARLSLAVLLAGGREPPLILDDPFSHFDEDRLHRAWALLEEFSKDRQVLVLTCTGRYDRLAGPGVNVIDIGG